MDKINNYTISRLALICDDSVWLASNKTNSILRFSLSTKRLINSYGVYDPIKEYMFLKILQIRDELYFLPYNAENMWKIDTSDDSIKKIDIGLTDEEKNIEGKFMSGVAFEDKLFLYGDNIHGIIIYDVTQKNYKRITSYFDCVEEHETRHFYSTIASNGRFGYVQFKNTNRIIMTDYISTNVEVLTIPNLPPQYYSFSAYNEDGLILYGTDGCEYLIDIEHLSVKAINELKFLQAYSTKRLSFMYKNGDRSIYLPAVWPEFYVKEGNSMQLKTIKLDEKRLGSMKEGDYTRYEFMCVYDNKLFVQSRIDGEVYVIDLYTFSVERFFFELDEQDFRMILTNELNTMHSVLLKEDENLKLDTFVYAIQMTRGDRCKTDAKD